MKGTVVGRWAILLLLMGVSMLLGWRANITFEPNPIHYVPVPVRHTLGWTTNNWMYER